MTKSLFLGLGGCGKSYIRDICRRIERTEHFLIVCIPSGDKRDKLFYAYSKFKKTSIHSILDEIEMFFKEFRKRLHYNLMHKPLSDNSWTTNISKMFFRYPDNRKDYSNKYEQYIFIRSIIKLCLKINTKIFIQSVLTQIYSLKELTRKEIFQIVFCQKGQAVYNYRLINLSLKNIEQKEVPIWQIERKQFPWEKCYGY